MVSKNRSSKRSKRSKASKKSLWGSDWGAERTFGKSYKKLKMKVIKF